ncbi:MAG: hypothetical protein JKY45_01835 [Emcibacter sp.]|nr:hypothetical protein [Emcibacter sp.]
METFKEHFQIYCNEIDILLGSYCLWKELQFNINDDDDLLMSSSRSWRVIKHSLQVTYFTVLNRILEGGNDNFSVFDLLQFCIDNIEIFKKENLKKRKIQNRDEEPDWLKEYMKNVHEPNETDFLRLQGEISKIKNMYRKKYRKIRNKILIHKDKQYIGNEKDLWNQTKITESEAILWTLADLENTIFSIYENGVKAILTSDQPDLSRYENDFGMLFKRLKQFNTT